MSKSSYYSIKEDLKAYPDAWCYIIVGGRKTGKTYGALQYTIENDLAHVFVKRTNDDVGLLCKGNRLGEKKKDYAIDLSPYKPLNRDLGTEIKAYQIDSGIGAFYDCSSGEPEGSPKGYLLSLNAIHKYKGFDLSECWAIIFDEFIPMPWQRVGRKEGEQLMDLYETVARDRTLRGREDLKLICLANSTNIYNPTCEVLEITDIMADMTVKGEHVRYIEDRGIFIRLLETPEDIREADEKRGIYKAMRNTDWGHVAFDNEFAYNDFTNVTRERLKGYRPIVELTYKHKMIYIYYKEGNYYLCTSRAKCEQSYNLNLEMDVRAFYLDYVIDILNAATRGCARFEKYSFYDLIVNYKSRFQVK
ncbi:MAG: phage DNA encapsidation protein [Erysipelotrichaceae bacterium]|nr:phage DNA encapsidation protein [Erysipelotrichaceae bacterium]